MVATETRKSERRHTVKRCPTCGCAENLVWRTYWKGGVGHVSRLECADQAACSNRWARINHIVWSLPVAP